MSFIQPYRWELIFSSLEEFISGYETPSVEQAVGAARDPFKVLISTMISLRTKDEVTLEASRRLFAAGDTPDKIGRLEVDTIAEQIYPAGFYKTKAKHIREASIIIRDRWSCTVPSNLDMLLELPGVGRKTANLVLSLGFGVDAICVDTHVHRISNRMGFVSTKTPVETELELMKKIPRKYWISINSLMVSFGKKTCTPISPFCFLCFFGKECPRTGVSKHR